MRPDPAAHMMGDDPFRSRLNAGSSPFSTNFFSPFRSPFLTRSNSFVDANDDGIVEEALVSAELSSLRRFNEACSSSSSFRSNLFL